MGYLAAVPSGKKCSRGYVYSGDLPEVPPEFEYLLDHLTEMGICCNSGGSLCALTWQEMAAWCSLSGVYLEYYEVRLLRELSEEYVDWFYRGQSAECVSPWVSEEAVKNVGNRLIEEWKREDRAMKRKANGLRKNRT